MENELYISLSAVVVSVVAFIYTYVSNTKRYELQVQYKNEILVWYKETNELLIRLRTESEINFSNHELKNELLSKLSSNIDYGRFYFPNLDKNDNYGNEKSTAYKGYRNLILDFLVFTYKLYKNDDYKKHPNHAEQLQKLFTSSIYEIIKPQENLKRTEKNTGINFYIRKSYEDILSDKSDLISIYLKK